VIVPVAGPITFASLNVHPLGLLVTSIVPPASTTVADNVIVGLVAEATTPVRNTITEKAETDIERDILFIFHLRFLFLRYLFF
jgi:hypothetical protein